MTDVKMMQIFWCKISKFLCTSDAMCFKLGDACLYKGSVIHFMKREMGLDRRDDLCGTDEGDASLLLAVATPLESCCFGLYNNFDGIKFLGLKCLRASLGHVTLENVYLPTSNLIKLTLFLCESPVILHIQAWQGMLFLP